MENGYVEVYLDMCKEANDSQEILLHIKEFFGMLESDYNKIDEREICVRNEIVALESKKENVRWECDEYIRNRHNVIKNKLEQDIGSIGVTAVKLIKEKNPGIFMLDKFSDEAKMLDANRIEVVKKLINVQNTKTELLRKISEQCINEEERKAISEREQKLVDIAKNIEDIKKSHAEDTQETIKLIDQGVRGFFTDVRIVEKISELKQKEFNSYVYTNPKKIPEYLELGRIVFNKYSLKPKMYSDYDKVKQLPVFDSRGSISLPFIKHRRSGFVLFSELNLNKYISELQNVLLKQLMMFPAGRLELIMLDKSSTSFFSPFYSCLSKGDNKDIIGSHVWGEDSDIVKQISEVRKRLSSFIHEYGNQYEENIKARENRENFRIVAITGFPEGFNNEALKDLRTIVKEGGSYGVNTFINADKVALERAMENPDKKALIEDIMSAADIISEENDQTVIDVVSQGTRNRFLVDLKGSDDNVDILSILSEIAKHIGEYNKDNLSLEDISSPIVNEENWLTYSSRDGFNIPIGRHGFDDIINITLGRKAGANKLDTRHHVLIEGTTGSGKSSVIHTIITSALLMYDPSELEIYYLDYKQGVEVSVYSEYDLPAFKVISVNGERVFGLKTLEKLVEIMNIRYEIMRDAEVGTSITLLNDYRNISPANKMSRIMLVIDEIGEFLKEDDEITSKSLSCIQTLAMQGRAAGIHMILAGQEINLRSSEIMNNMTLRIAFSGSKRLLESNSEYLEATIKAGNHAVFNDAGGSVVDNKGFRVAYITPEEQKVMLSTISKVQQGEQYSGRSEGGQKVFYSCVDSNYRHPFNDVKMYGKVSCILQDDLCDDGVLFVGESFDFGDELDVRLDRRSLNNLLIVGTNLQKTYKLLYFSCLSLVHNNLIKSVNKQNIVMVDFGIDDITGKKQMMNLENHFVNQIARYLIDDTASDMERVIESAKSAIGRLYEEVKRRKTLDYKEAQSLFLVINGAEYLHMMSSGNVYNNDSEDILGVSVGDNNDVMSQIKYILKEGSDVGIHCIVIAGAYSPLQDYFGCNFENYFSDRIAFELNADEMKNVVRDINNQSLGVSSAVFYHNGKRDNRVFRIYDYPKTDWVNAYAEQYEELKQK